MEFINWDDVSLSVGVKTVDEQHRQLLGMINSIYTSLVNGSERSVVGDVIAKMQDYVLVHFTTEEELMGEQCYPDLEAHRIEHRRFMDKVEDFDLDRLLGSDSLPMEVMEFLKSWLVHHIQEVDMRMGSYLREQGFAEPQA